MPLISRRALLQALAAQALPARALFGQTRLHGKPKPLPNLTAEKKSGKAALNTFAELAAFFKKEEPKPEPKPEPEPKPKPVPVARPHPSSKKRKRKRRD